MGFFNSNETNASIMNAATSTENEVVDFAEAKKEQEVKPKRKPFAIWEVGGQQYKLKLRTQKILELEAKYKTNLINIMGSGEGGMPALSVMLDITHAAMADFNHGISKSDVQNLFSKYEEDGGSQLEFYMNVYMDIFAVSGFFSVNQSEKISQAMEEAKNESL